LFPEFSGQDSGSFESLKLDEEPAAVPKVSEILDFQDTKPTYFLPVCTSLAILLIYATAFLF